MAKKQSKPSKQDVAGEPSFEEALAQLEAIVRLLEEGEVGLDEALEQYEKGVGLLRRGYDLLRRAERRVELLSGVDAEGNPLSEPMADPSSSSNDLGPGRKRPASSPAVPPEEGAL